MISPVLFYTMAFIVIFGALMMVANKNILYSALSMILCFIGVAGLYATLQLSFFAVVQLMVYVGAITILMLFAILLTRHASGDMDKTNRFSGNAIGAGVIALGVAIVMSIVIRSIPFVTPVELNASLTQLLGIEIFGTYLLPVELVAILLIVGMIGAIVIGKEDDGR